MKDYNEILDSLMLCTEGNGSGCEYCAYKDTPEESSCRILLLNDVAIMRAKHDAFRRHMFNRCMALSHGETCDLCTYKDECTAERTLKPI
jgi:hypothetical protein